MSGCIAVLVHDGFYGCGTGAGVANRGLLQALAAHHGHVSWRVLPVGLVPDSPEFSAAWHDRTRHLLAGVGGGVVVDPVDNGTGGRTRFGDLDCFRAASADAARRLNALRGPARPGLVLAVDTPFHGIGAHLDEDLAARTLVLPRSTALLHEPHNTARAAWEHQGWSSILAQGGHVGAISAHMRLHLEADYGLAPQEIVDMPDGLASGARESAPAPALPAAAQGGFALSLGRAAPYKGFEDLIEAWALLQHHGERLPHLILAAVTETAEPTPYQHHLARQLRQTGVEATLWTGFDPGVRALFTHVRARTVVVPSRVEPFGLIPLEVFAAGGPPVVATAVGGLAETVQEPRTGFTAAPADPVSLANAITRALSLNPAGREQLRARTAQVLQEHDYTHTVTSVVQRLAPWACRS
ncbi:glycosyltransferase family 4 protein [Nocardiopsis sp. NPDC006198]|uniref:glycosyltransferase family 4 protein n=1 Tax=Nocardiopsis sp. NPDC006198 TaxID=3154472 RepID=UPI0033A600C2